MGKLENQRLYREKHRERINRERAEQRAENGRTDNTPEKQREWLRRKKLGLPNPVRVLKGLDKEREKATKKRWLAANAQHEAKRRHQYYVDNKQRAFETTYRNYKKHQGTGDAADMAALLRSRVKSIRKVGGDKLLKSSKYIGCSFKEWMEHLGPNHKRMKDLDLQIDHIWPVSMYDLTDPAEQLKCFNYRNTRLVTAAINRKKTGKAPEMALALSVPKELWPAGKLDYYDQ